MSNVKRINYHVIADGRTVQLKEGEWVIVNPDKATEAQSICAVSVRNAPEGTPRFAYFLVGKEVNELRRDPDLNRIDEEIAKVWPGYREILKQKVEPVPDGKGGYANVDEWRKAPEPGYFDLAGYTEYWVAGNQEG